MFEGHPLVLVEADGEVRATRRRRAEAIDLDAIRPDLAEVLDRHAIDARRRRGPTRSRGARKTDQRTARENVDDLVRPGHRSSSTAPLVIAAQRRRRTLDDLIARTPADGLVAGIGRVNGDLFADAEPGAS